MLRAGEEPGKVMEISYSLVNSTSLTQLMETQFNTKIREARFVDATEGTPENIKDVIDSGARVREGKSEEAAKIGRKYKKKKMKV